MVSSDSDFKIDPMPIMHSTLEGASKLRQIRLRSLTQHDPKLLELTIDELRNMADCAREFALDCGPMDPAYQHFATQTMLYDTVAFIKSCEDRRISREDEVALSRFVRILGSDIFELTSVTALEKAQETEEKADAASPRDHRRWVERMNAYVELASVLEGWERAQCRTLAA